MGNDFFSSLGICHQFTTVCTLPHPRNEIKRLVFDTMKFHEDNLKEIVNLFPCLQEVVIKKCTMREGNLEYSNFSFDLADLLTHLEIFSQMRHGFLIFFGYEFAAYVMMTFFALCKYIWHFSKGLTGPLKCDHALNELNSKIRD